MQTPARSHHALLQNRTKTFSRQTISQGIRFRSACNVCQKVLYKQASHKVYRCIEVGSTWHIYFYIILRSHTWRMFLHQPVKVKLPHSSLLRPRTLHTSLFTSKYDPNINLSKKIPLFPYLGLGLGLGCNYPLTRSRYISIHATTQIDYYFLFLSSLQVL